MNSQMSNKLNSLIAVLTYIVNLSVEVRARASAVSGTYRELVLLILNSIASNAREYDVKQIDHVDDFYHNFSIKSGIKCERE